MARLLKLLLATSVLFLSSVAVGPGTAHAEHSEPCLTGSPAPVGTEPLTVGVGGEEVHVPGVKVQLCGSPHGNVSYAAQWLAPRIEPGTCDPSIYDPACFTLYLESYGVPYYTHFTVYTYIDGVPQEPIRVNVPPTGEPFSKCIVSVGYRAAPTHDCPLWVDLGQ